MCSIVGYVEQRAMSRARLLGAGAAAAAGLTAIPRQTTAQVAQSEDRIAKAKAAARGARSRLILLGTGGGPSWGGRRRSFSAALLVGDSMYMVDAGDGAGPRLAEALAPLGTYALMQNLRGLFFTHLHSDHTVDYPNLLLYGPNVGLETRKGKPLEVFGPGRRGQMEPVFAPPGVTPATPVVVSPSNPTPGVEDMTNLIYQAYATDINDRMRDNGKPDPHTLVNAHDIKLPAIPGFVSPNATPAPDMEPFTIYHDDRVKVSATLVNHAPIWPAFAYRFDTDDGAVVFSGDTGPCANLVRLARGAKILVHEVIVTKWVDARVPLPRSAADEGLRNHLLSAHTPVEAVGKIAAAAGVSQLVLSHIVPAAGDDADLLPAQQGFGGTLIIGEDLLQIPL
jgi:ribonuclease BN (tRNA processing enzyme)